MELYISSVGPVVSVVSVVSVPWSPSSFSVRPVRPVVHPVVVVRTPSVRPVVSRRRRRRPLSVRPSRPRRQGSARGPYQAGFLLTRVCAIVLRLLYGLG